MNKTCTGKCGKTKDESKFYGRMKSCKDCHRQAMALGRIRQKERKARRQVNRHSVKIGDTFFAKIRKHPHSTNISGMVEFARQTIGEFVCTGAGRNVVNAIGRQFDVDMFDLEVITE